MVATSRLLLIIFFLAAISLTMVIHNLCSPTTLLLFLGILVLVILMIDCSVAFSWYSGVDTLDDGD
jgi:hypothetical protein